MTMIETTAVVGDDRRLLLQLPPEVAPGEHRIVLVIKDPESTSNSWSMEDWPVHDAELIDPNFTMRREELYGDAGR